MKSILNHGKLERVATTTSHDYSLANGTSLLGTSTSLIPNLSGISGNRLLLGSKSFLQAISLTHREQPWVHSSATTEGESFIESLGRHCSAIANHAGEVSKVGKYAITIKDTDGKEHDHDIYHNYVSGKKTYLHHEAVVKVGDKVKKGDLLATSNFTDNKGNLALGVNLNTAIMPYRGSNFEDAIVLSQHGADKLKASQIFVYHLEKRPGVETAKDKYVSLYPNRYLSSQYNKIDSDGVIKKGSKVATGDPVILAYTPKSLKSSDIQLGKLAKVMRNAYNDSSEVWDYNSEGEVTAVANHGGMITVQIKTERPIVAGDKLNMFSGNKGVISEIISHENTPTDEQGKPIDLFMNSMSITSRVAPGMLNVLAAGKVAEKQGKPIKITPFTKDSSVEAMRKLLKDNNVKDVEEIYDPMLGRNVKATVGPLYFTRLSHISEDKLTMRGEGQGYDLNHQPSKSGQDASSKKVGHQMTMALLAHGAKNVLEDIGSIKSTKNDEYWRRLKLGQPLPPLKVPFIFNKFIDSLKGSGINVHEYSNGSYQILPQTDKDILAMSNGKIENPNSFKIKKNELIPEKGGFFDPVNVGILGDKFNHIDLNMKVPNPISEDYLRKLLGVTKVDYEKMVTNETLESALKSINIDDRIKEYKGYVKTGKKAKRNTSLQVLSFLNTLKKSDMQLKDLMLSKIPVIPAQYRPASITGDMVMSADVNALYKDLMLNNEAVKGIDSLPDDTLKHKVKLDQYNGVKAIYGFADSINTKNKQKQLKGLLTSVLGIHGGSGKESMFQAKVVNKPVDLVTRGVIVPNSKLALDEISLPQESVWSIYAPFVIRRLTQRGIPATQAKDFVENHNPIALRELQEEIKIRPVIATRDPQLWKFSSQGFFVKPNLDPKDTTCKVHPLVCKGFGADFDGDQENFHAPVSEKARLEIIDKMMPSKNLLNNKDFTPVYVPSNESALGLYQSSTEDNNNTAKQFTSSEDVVRAFEQGKLAIGDRVTV